MEPTLQTLIQLQAVDTVILDLQQKISRFPEIIQQLDKQLAESKDKILSLQTSIEEQEKNRRSKERDIEMNLEKMKKYQGQLLQVKTNKEYSALLFEIKGLKSQNSLAEDDILELMEGVERAKYALSEAEKELEQEKVRVEEVKQNQQQEHEQVQQLLETEEKKREALLENVEPRILREYSKLLKVRNGVAVTSVLEGGVCSGCHVALTPQMFAEVKSGQYIHRCPTCFRFLYWSNHDDSTSEEEA